MKLMCLILVMVLSAGALTGCRMGGTNEETTGTTATAGTTQTDGSGRSGMPGFDFEMGR